MTCCLKTALAAQQRVAISRRTSRQRESHRRVSQVGATWPGGGMAAKLMWLKRGEMEMRLENGGGEGQTYASILTFLVSFYFLS